MARLRDAAQAADQIKGLLDELKSELTDGKADFEKLVQLSDNISEQADSLAEMFGSMNDVLMGRLGNSSRSSSSSGSSRSSSSDGQSSGSRSSRQKSGSRS
jgi:methyl-accepting chemotaxis protein